MKSKNPKQNDKLTQAMAEALTKVFLDMGVPTYEWKGYTNKFISYLQETLHRLDNPN